MSESHTEQPLVAVFHAELPELLPLAEGALQQAGIDYLIQRAGTGVPVGFGHPPEFGGAEGAADICVNADDAERARVLLADLTLAASAPVGAPAPTPAPTDVHPASGPRTSRLTETDSGALIGDITERQLTCLVDELEEESSTDRDYYIDGATIDLLETAGAGTELVAMLRRALGSRDGIEISWAPL